MSDMSLSDLGFPPARRAEPRPDPLIAAGLAVLRWMVVVGVAMLPFLFLALVTPADILTSRAVSDFRIAPSMPDSLVAEYAFAAMAIVFFYAHRLFDVRFAPGAASNRRFLFYVVWTLIIICFVVLMAKYVSFFVQFTIVDQDLSDDDIRRAKTAISACFTAVATLTLVSELIVTLRRRV